MIDNAQNGKNDLQKRIDMLFIDTNTNKLNKAYLTNKIIINPKQIVDLTLSAQNSKGQQQLTVLQKIFELLKEFPLNSVHLIKQGKLILPNNKSENIFDSTLNILTKLLDDYQNRGQLQNRILDTLISIFQSLLALNDIPIEVLKSINSFLTKHYYQNTLNFNILNPIYSIIEKIYKKSLSTNIERFPFFYFLGNRDEIKVVLTNPKWTFTKGIGFYAWIYIQKQIQYLDASLFLIRTDDNKQIQLKLKNNKEIHFVINKKNKQSESILVAEIQLLKWTFVALELETAGGFSFGGYQYKLNMRINNMNLKNLNISIPKYNSSDIITQIIFLRNFIGRCTSICLMNKADKEKQIETMSKYKYGLYSEELVEEVIQETQIKKQSIFLLYSPCRYFQNILLNCNSEENNAMFTGRVNNVSCRNLKIYNRLDELMPYLYLTKFLQKDKSIIFYKILNLLYQICAQYNYQQYFLMIGYFIISDKYNMLDEKILEFFSKIIDQEKFKQIITIVISNFSLQSVVESKCKIPENLKLLLGNTKFDFYTELKERWNSIWSKSQSFQGFWSYNFVYQNNKQINLNDYIYKDNLKKNYQWSINNFSTRQFCRPIIQPIFIDPEYVTKQQHQIQLQMKQDQSNFLQILNQPIIQSQSIQLENIVSKRQFLKNLITKAPEKKQSRLTENSWKDYSTQCLFIFHLHVIKGILQILQEGYIAFTSNHNQKTYDHLCIISWKSKQTISYRWKIQQIKSIKKRRFNQSKNSIQIIFQDCSSFVFYLIRKDCDKFLSKLGSIKIHKLPLQHFTKSNKPSDWIQRKISNFHYLMWLNFVAGRSYQDLTQYPILPWIVTNFNNKLQLEDPKGYRDLTKNMGSLGNQSRIKQFLTKYQSKTQYELISQYHYGTHYSSSAIICNFLIRLRPYADGAKALQSGKFDCADRVFSHYEQSWNNATNSPSDVRELIPEFYVLPQMFLNLNNYDYGMTQNKERIDNVSLPPWARKNPYIFVAEIRKTFQSEIVSKTITGWIDLVFGQKQRGKQAIQCMNIFYPLTYEDSIDLDAVDEQNQKISFESQIAHFGQTPSQIIPSKSHPTRIQPSFKSYGRLLSDGGQFKIFKNIDKDEKNRTDIRIFNSIFETKNTILKIKFFKPDMYAVFKKRQLTLYKIAKSEKKNQDLLITKEKTFRIQPQKRLDIMNLQSNLPVEHFSQKFIVGGYFGGYTYIVFYEQIKKSQMIRLSNFTITALGSFENKLFVGNCKGELNIYVAENQYAYKTIHQKQDHFEKINELEVVANQRMFCTCSDDGRIFIYNLFSFKVLRTIVNPNNSGILYARISSCPLFCVVFFSKGDNKLYSYSINGQYLKSFEQSSGYIYNPRIVKNSQQLQTLIYINANKSINIEELPFLQLKRKVQLKKTDTPKISSFECSPDGRVAVVGTIQGNIYIVIDPQSF